MYSRFIDWHFGVQANATGFPIQLDSGRVVSPNGTTDALGRTSDLHGVEFDFSRSLLSHVFRYAVFYLACLVIYAGAATAHSVRTGTGFSFGVYFSPVLEFGLFVFSVLGAVFCFVLWLVARRRKVCVVPVPAEAIEHCTRCFRFDVCSGRSKPRFTSIGDFMVKPLLPTAVFQIFGDVRLNGDTGSVEFSEIVGEEEKEPFTGCLRFSRRGI
ncbi:MAG: hypothetical protein ACFHWZ_15715 [Phycisphaerales bacterium]